MLKNNWAPTYRLVAFPDDEEPVLFGIFFRVLFNCGQKGSCFVLIKRKMI